MNTKTELQPSSNNTGTQKTKSKTAYPYNDLDSSIEVAKAIRDRAGGLCSNDQLAVFLNYSSARSGTYYSRINAAKMFGLVQGQGDNLSPTERAISILSPVMPDDEGRARLDAFLSVPLFSSIYDQYKSQSLPPEVGIKNLLKTRYGIVEDRVLPAFRILMDSAEQAGLFKTTGDRTKMIKPVFSGLPQTEVPKPPEIVTPPERDKSRGGGSDGPPGGIHTAIVGLLRELPPAGSNWQPAKKERFLSAFKAILDVVYPEMEDST